MPSKKLRSRKDREIKEERRNQDDPLLLEGFGDRPIRASELLVQPSGQELIWRDALRHYDLEKVLLNVALYDFKAGRMAIPTCDENETADSLINRLPPPFADNARQMMDAWRPRAEKIYKNIYRHAIAGMLEGGMDLKSQPNTLRFKCLLTTQDVLIAELCKAYHMVLVRPMVVRRCVTNAIRNVLARYKKTDNSRGKKTVTSKAKFNGVYEDMPTIDLEKEALRRQRAERERAKRAALEAEVVPVGFQAPLPRQRHQADVLLPPQARPTRNPEDKAASIARAAQHSQRLRDQEDMRRAMLEVLREKRILADAIMRGDD